MIVVFDVDGTLIESTDWCFDAAFVEAAGFALDDAFFDALEEVTAHAIVHQALKALSPDEINLKKQAVEGAYMARLRLAHERDAASFYPTVGALALLQDFKARGHPIAIATGDWREPIAFKLQAAGVPMEGIAMATSSERNRRAEIIAEAVRLAGFTLEEAVYVGDGLWDLRACQSLGIPFIGVGRRKAALQAAGAAHLLDSLDPTGFWPLHELLKSTRTKSR